MMTQEALHASVENIENETHVISNRQIVVYLSSVIMLVASAVGWYFHNKSIIKDDQIKQDKRFDQIIHIIREKSISDSLNFLNLSNKIDNNNQSMDDRLQTIEDLPRRKRQPTTPARYVTEQYKNGRNGDLTLNPVY